MTVTDNDLETIKRVISPPGTKTVHLLNLRDKFIVTDFQLVITRRNPGNAFTLDSDSDLDDASKYLDGNDGGGDWLSSSVLYDSNA